MFRNYFFFVVQISEGIFNNGSQRTISTSDHLCPWTVGTKPGRLIVAGVLTRFRQHWQHSVRGELFNYKKVQKYLSMIFLNIV